MRKIVANPWCNYGNGREHGDRGAYQAPVTLVAQEERVDWGHIALLRVVFGERALPFPSDEEHREKHSKRWAKRNEKWNADYRRRREEWNAIMVAENGTEKPVTIRALGPFG